MKICSWNVNGLRAVARKGFADWLAETDIDVLGIQEVRAHPGQVPPEVAAPAGWHTHFHPAQRPGYSGVGLYARRPWDSLEISLDEPTFDDEGRLQIARFGALTIANVYFPNGSGKDRDNGRIPYKLSFYRALFERLEPQRRAGAPLVVIGDFNTAHQEIDLARPKQNTNTSGFCAEERAELDRWLQAGWVDSFRQRVAEGGHYTWWSNRPGIREKNIGWRIDYALLSPGAMPFLRDAAIWPHVQGSDHCPVYVALDPAVVDG